VAVRFFQSWTHEFEQLIRRLDEQRR